MRFVHFPPAALLSAFILPAMLTSHAVAQGAQAVPIGSGAATSAAVPAPVIMIVDDQRVIGSSKAFKSIQAQIDGQHQSYQKEFSGKQNELEQAAADLEHEQRSGSLTADQLEEKRHQLVKRQEEIQKDADSRRQALQKTYAEALDKVKQALLEVVQGLAQERHANLVLIRSDVILFDKSYDASADALTRLDNKITSVAVQQASSVASASTSAAPTSTKKR